MVGWWKGEAKHGKDMPSRSIDADKQWRSGQPTELSNLLSRNREAFKSKPKSKPNQVSPFHPSSFLFFFTIRFYLFCSHFHPSCHFPYFAASLLPSLFFVPFSSTQFETDEVENWAPKPKALVCVRRNGTVERAGALKYSFPPARLIISLVVSTSGLCFRCCSSPFIECPL